jgi:pimeloyl-ACP methyl ester carboxylesterase
MGVTGISLGGYTSALLAAVEERLHFSIPNVPVVSLLDLVLEWFPINVPVKALLKATNTSVREARHMVAVHSPLTWQPLIPKERLMVIAGAGDRLAPPKHARLLWDHWDRPRIHWFPGNHLIHLDKGKYLKEIAGFLREIGFDRH